MKQCKIDDMIKQQKNGDGSQDSIHKEKVVMEMDG